MKKEVVIKMEAIQSYPGEEQQRTVTKQEAEYYLRAGSHYVIFEEKQEGFTESTKAVLKIKNGSVELTKKGLINAHMVFEESKLHYTEYRTPFGMIMLGVKTKHMHISVEGDLLIIVIEYSLETTDSHMADCKMCMEIKG